MIIHSHFDSRSGPHSRTPRQLYSHAEPIHWPETIAATHSHSLEPRHHGIHTPCSPHIAHGIVLHRPWLHGPTAIHSSTAIQPHSLTAALRDKLLYILYHSQPYTATQPPSPYIQPVYTARIHNPYTQPVYTATQPYKSIPHPHTHSQPFTAKASHTNIAGTTNHTLHSLTPPSIPT
jgi:hypothetical protein